MDSAFKKEIGLLSTVQYKKLNNAHIMVLGLGGVGGYVFEGLIRVGIGNMYLVDKDTFEESNLNRQLASNIENIGKSKVDEYKKRAFQINPNINILTSNICITKDNCQKLINDYIKTVNNDLFIADCIDDVQAKISIIKYCQDNNLKLISCMGTANHIVSTNIKISKLKNTRYCPLAKKIREEMKKYGDYNPNVLFIDEEPIDIKEKTYDNNNTSTISYIPAIAGLKMSEYIIKNI